MILGDLREQPAQGGGQFFMGAGGEMEAIAQKHFPAREAGQERVGIQKINIREPVRLQREREGVITGKTVGAGAPHDEGGEHHDRTTGEAGFIRHAADRVQVFLQGRGRGDAEEIAGKAAEPPFEEVRGRRRRGGNLFADMGIFAEQTAQEKGAAQRRAGIGGAELEQDDVRPAGEDFFGEMFPGTRGREATHGNNVQGDFVLAGLFQGRNSPLQKPGIPGQGITGNHAGAVTDNAQIHSWLMRLANP